MSDEKTPTDWASDVKRYAPDADDGVIAKIVSYCGIALRSKDASLVSFSDPAETGRVRENFCRKKLALEDSDEVLDAAIAAVGERMSDDTTRNRVTVYYLLAEHFGKLDLFAAKGAATAAAVTPIVPLAAAATAAAAEPVAATAPAVAAPPPFVRGVYTLRSTRPVGAGGMAAGGPANGANGADDGFVGVAALVFGGAAAIMIFAAIAGSYIGGKFDAAAPPPPAPAATTAPVEPAAPVIPEGAGVMSEVVEGRPKVSVYFAVGKSDIAPDFAAAVAPIKAWLDANPDDRVQLSGFTDPTGNAAANAALAKSRAQAVAADLNAAGVAAERMDLVKPADSSDETADLSGARRVEITVTGG